jgi:ribosomal protein S27AE
VSDASAEPAACRPPRCPRCGIALSPASLPPGVFGIAGEPCFECDDASPTRGLPWACPRCGGVFLIDPAAR